MFARSTIAVNLIYLVIGLHVAAGWLAPERCQQTRFSNDVVATFNAPTVGNITEIAVNQNAKLREKYQQSKFFGVPIRGKLHGCRGCNYDKQAASSCVFHTYEPSLLSSVYCQDNLTCKLSHTVQTMNSYASAEGYNWGVKVSPKVKLFEIFEIGGEASVGATYSCTYTKAKTVTDGVECSIEDGDGKTLQLYSVRSDMECQFGNVEMVPEERNGKSIAYAEDGYFSVEDTREVEAHPLLRSQNGMVLPDVDRMSDTLLEKMWRVFPDYNPYTDVVALWQPPSNASVLYTKEGRIDPGPKRIIPFTNPAGNSIFQYACVLT